VERRGLSYRLALRSLPEIAPAVAADIHVPGYFYLLHVWVRLAGESEFGLRSLSAFFSVISVALTFALGRRLYGTVAGIAAAAFVTFNTFSIYYAQEARMYSLLAAVSAAGMWAFLDFIQPLPNPSIAMRKGKRRTTQSLGVFAVQYCAARRHKCCRSVHPLRLRFCPAGAGGDGGAVAAVTGE
jgi:hypothetical protein